MILDSSGKPITSVPDVKINHRVARSLDSILSPDDKIIFRCNQCQTFFLPSEFTVVKAVNKLKNEMRVMLVCPNYDTEGCDCTSHTALSRHQYELTKKAEAVGMAFNPEMNEFFDPKKIDLTIN
jgi:hypothetical protein